MVDLVCVAPADVEKVWPFIEPMLRWAIEQTGLSDFKDCESALFTGSHLLWMATTAGKIEAIATTQLIKVKDNKVCVIVACSGIGRERWLHLIGGLEQYAKNEGCSAMRIYGRKGWERVLDGYKADYVILQKELN